MWTIGALIINSNGIINQWTNETKQSNVKTKHKAMPPNSDIFATINTNNKQN